MPDPEFMKKRGEEILEEVGLEGLLDFSFNKFITLNVIKILYILGIIVACLIAVIVILGNLAVGVGGFIAALIVMPILAVLWIIGLRVMLELVVVIFRIGQNTSLLAGAGTLEAVPPAVEEPGAPQQPSGGATGTN